MNSEQAAELTADLLAKIESSGFGHMIANLLSSSGIGLTAKEEVAWSLMREIGEATDRAPSERGADFVARFRHVGFFRATEAMMKLDGEQILTLAIDFADTRPRERVQLFRVSDSERKLRMHWSTQLAPLMQFAKGGASDWNTTPHLYRCFAPPEAVLAILPGDEWVIDTTDLYPENLGEIECAEMVPRESIDAEVSPYAPLAVNGLVPSPARRVVPIRRSAST